MVVAHLIRSTWSKMLPQTKKFVEIPVIFTFQHSGYSGIRKNFAGFIHGQS